MTTDTLADDRGLPNRLRDGITFDRAVGVLSILALLLIPTFSEDIFLLKMAGALFFAIFVMSWDFASGYTGELSFGHSAFFGIGGYTTGILNMQYGVDTVVGIICGGLFAGIAGLLIGIPSLRVEGPYFGLVTLIVPLALMEFLTFTRDITGGQTGLIGIENVTLDPVVTYYIGLGAFLVALLVFLIVTRSDTGTILTAIRENEEVVVASGINPDRYKIYAFALSGLIGGLAAAVFVHTTAGSVTPSLLLALTVNINIIVAAILGGIGTITASGAGGILFFLLQDYMGSVSYEIPGLGIPLSDFNVVLFFAILLVLLFYAPEGIFKTLYDRIRATLSSDESVVVDGGGASPLAKWRAEFVERIRREKE